MQRDEHEGAVGREVIDQRVFNVIVGGISLAIIAGLWVAAGPDGILAFLAFIVGWWFLIKPWTDELGSLIYGGESA